MITNNLAFFDKDGILITEVNVPAMIANQSYYLDVYCKLITPVHYTIKRIWLGGDYESLNSVFEWGKRWEKAGVYLKQYTVGDNTHPYELLTWDYGSETKPVIPLINNGKLSAVSLSGIGNTIVPVEFSSFAEILDLSKKAIHFSVNADGVIVSGNNEAHSPINIVSSSGTTTKGNVYVINTATGNKLEKEQLITSLTVDNVDLKFKVIAKNNVPLTGLHNVYIPTRQAEQSNDCLKLILQIITPPVLDKSQNLKLNINVE